MDCTFCGKPDAKPIGRSYAQCVECYQEHGYYLNEERMKALSVAGFPPTLRDMFAMHALTGLATGTFEPESLSELAYEIADAMLKAREGER